MVSVGKVGSDQEVETPDDFIDAIKARWGPIVFDLAASAENAKADSYFTEADDALKQDWPATLEPFPPGVAWLNPTYKNIEKWVFLSAAWSGSPLRQDRHTHLVLVPEGFRTKWYAKYCELICTTHILKGYFRFVGHDHPFPKALTLLEYPKAPCEPVIQLWDWRRGTRTY